MYVCEYIYIFLDKLNWNYHIYAYYAPTKAIGYLSKVKEINTSY